MGRAASCQILCHPLPRICRVRPQALQVWKGRFSLLHSTPSQRVLAQFALRWRTEHEVLSGAGETTCGNTRCEHHSIPDHLIQAGSHATPQLTTLELPFAYVEGGESKSALVKVVLCPRCLDKLMYKRRKEKQKAIETETGDRFGAGPSTSHTLSREEQHRRSYADSKERDIGRDGSTDKTLKRERRSRHRSPRGQGRSRPRNPRSRSPRR